MDVALLSKSSVAVFDGGGWSLGQVVATSTPITLYSEQSRPGDVHVKGTDDPGYAVSVVVLGAALVI